MEFTSPSDRPRVRALDRFFDDYIADGRARIPEHPHNGCTDFQWRMAEAFSHSLPSQCERLNRARRLARRLIPFMWSLVALAVGSSAFIFWRAFELFETRRLPAGIAAIAGVVTLYCAVEIRQGAQTYAATRWAAFNQLLNLHRLHRHLATAMIAGDAGQLQHLLSILAGEEPAITSQYGFEAAYRGDFGDHDEDTMTSVDAASSTNGS
jgi:hypothetical protein